MATPGSSILRALLREARLARGLTQENVAERLGRPQSFVSKYETGERRLDVLELMEVLRALAIDAPTFVGELQSAMEGDDEARHDL
jgi:transcriptional regulator with XRE-family HTH domain